jgi:hypothetical protein
MSLRAERSNLMQIIVPSEFEGFFDQLGIIRGSDCFVVSLLAMTAVAAEACDQV